MTRAWYVVAREPEPDEGEGRYVNVFGPFINETDARAYAMDLANDNGWKSVEAEFLQPDDAADLATEKVLWPYDHDQSGEAD